jgi:8-oxo-dGTP diphosphatase
MKEEFNIGVTIGECLGESIYHYDHGSIKLLAYRTTWVAGEFTIRDHQAIEWIKIDNLANYNFGNF